MFYSLTARKQIAAALVCNLEINRQPGMISAEQLEALAEMSFGLCDTGSLVYKLFTLDIISHKVRHSIANHRLGNRHGLGLTNRVHNFLRNRPELTADQILALSTRWLNHCARHDATTQARLVA